MHGDSGVSSVSFHSLGPHGFHRLRYLSYGDADNPEVLVCVHGLTRNAHDFHFLARALASRFRVVSLDVAGRGDSEWLPQAADYGYPQYLQDAAALLAHLRCEQVSWLGTSMGGLMGMMLAAMPGNPIRRLVINDIGPHIAAHALARIVEYVGRTGTFAELSELEVYLREIHAPFGDLSDAQWRFLAEHSAVDCPGGCMLHYDPAIGEPLRDQEIVDIDLWAIWDQVKCPTLALRGAESDILAASVAEEMTRRGPKCELIEIPGVGHAPALMSDAQIELVGSWFQRNG